MTRILRLYFYELDITQKNSFMQPNGYFKGVANGCVIFISENLKKSEILSANLSTFLRYNLRTLSWDAVSLPEGGDCSIYFALEEHGLVMHTK